MYLLIKGCVILLPLLVDRPSDNDNLRTLLKYFSTNLGLIGPIILLKICCSRNKYIFENIKHSIQEIGSQVFSLLHYILKAFASLNPHRIQPPV